MQYLIAVVLACFLCAPVWAEKLPVPAASDVDSATTKIRAIYKADYAAKGGRENGVLLRKLADASRELRGDSLVEYAMLTEVIDLATRSGDTPSAMSAITQLDAKFEIDAPLRREQALLSIGKVARTKDQAAQLLEQCLPLIEARVKDDLWEPAMPMIKLVQEVARAHKDLPSAAGALESANRWTFEQAEFAKLKSAFAKLVTEPENPAANTSTGRYYAFVREQWDKAVPMLARGDDTTIKAAASLEQGFAVTVWNEVADADKKKAVVQIKTGDAWMAAATNKGQQQRTSPQRSAMGRRAWYWYRMADPTQAGIELVTLRRKIEDARQLIVGPGKPTFVLDLSKEQLANVQRVQSKYYLLVEETLSYVNADAWARSRGGQLVCIADKAENEFVDSLVDKKRTLPIWIGATSEGAGRWKWADGSVWRYSNWSKAKAVGDEPPQSCAYMATGAARGVWDYADGLRRNWFVVQWEVNKPE